MTKLIITLAVLLYVNGITCVDLSSLWSIFLPSSKQSAFPIQVDERTLCAVVINHIFKVVLYENGYSEGGELIYLNSEDCGPHTEFSNMLLNKSGKMLGRSGHVRL
jgi:hypothetical protein